ncbi:Alpha/Beta hydrolase protein [Chiua virens]|nr:Alpha/Beta hydrolase protein [Chiua virens]
MSAALHMVTNGGNVEGLFRAAIMHSGTTLPLGDITQGQPYYDALVAETGCSGATDTLQCLREAPYETLSDAVNQSPGFYSYQTVDLPWVPRVDGVFLTADPRHLVQQGSVASIPFIASDCDDEGTLFSLSTLNITTDAQFEKYISTYLLSNASTAELAQLMTYYPSDPALGSPFDTGDNNALTPQFKRIAAFLGDFVFQAPRRFLLQSLSRKQNVWTYLYKRGKLTPYIGASHGSDLLNAYTGGDILPYLLRFVTHLNPNTGESKELYWPQYDAIQTAEMLVFQDGSIPLALTTDSYRAKAMAYMTNVSWTHPW